VGSATTITQDVFKARRDYGPALCELWREMVNQPQAQATLSSAWGLLQKDLSCQPE
jgi:hypothetical protein